MLILLALLLAPAQAQPTQIERGEALFLDAANGCASCHALKGKGTAVGPDLSAIARISPAGLATAIRSTVTQYVQTTKMKSGGGDFPGIASGDQVFDLSKMPPEARGAKADIASTSANSTWKHPPATRKYTPAQMADIIAYVRYAGAGVKTPVDPDDVK
jgi:mono/diheme cytochrome c family protein